MARHPSGNAASRTDRHQHWRAHVDAQARGSITQRAYCEAHELAYSTFTYWRRRLHEPGTSATTPVAVSAQAMPASGFVPVAIRPVPATSAATVPAPLAIVLPGGLRIEGIDVANIDAVVALVAAL